MKHKDVQFVNVFQGRYGGISPKPTSLLILCGGDINVQQHMEDYTTSKTLPPALVMGWHHQQREYQTAS